MTERLIEHATPAHSDPAIAPVRVLLLIKGLGRGGAEQLVVHAAAYGNASRFEYHVAYLLPWKDAFVPDLRALGIPVSSLDGGKGLAWVARLRRYVRDHGIDIIHVHSPLVASVVRGSLRHIPIVTTEHNVWERYHRATYLANMSTFPRNAHVFAVSDEVRDSIRYPRALGFLRKPPLETLHHGIDLDRVAATPSPAGIREELGIPVGAPVVGTVANFKPHKGHEYVLQTAALVAQRLPDVRFVLVGQGPREAELRREAKKLGVTDTVVFAGFREDRLRVARAFDVFILSSLHEGLPLALLEAMALGCPPVVTRVGGIGAVVDDARTGFIVEPRDPRTQADRIISLLEDGALRSRIGAAAKERAAGFDVRPAIRRIESVYEELVR